MNHLIRTRPSCCGLPPISSHFLHRASRSAAFRQLIPAMRSEETAKADHNKNNIPPVVQQTRSGGECVSYGFWYMKRTRFTRLFSMAIPVVPKNLSAAVVSHKYFASEQQQYNVHARIVHRFYQWSANSNKVSRSCDKQACIFCFFEFSVVF